MKRKPSFSKARRTNAGFTLAELLVVIAIIGVLMALLVPAISKIRKSAQAANTQAQIGQLSAAIQSYFGDFNAYPGPVPNSQLGLATSNITGVKVASGPTPTWTVGNMSMAENLYLGLLGGLEPTAVGAATFQFNVQKAGVGPQQLGGTPKKFSAYTDNADVSSGEFIDGNSTKANDTPIPEFIDRFPDPLPLLYLRARVGAPGVAGTGAAADPYQQYDAEQVISYTESEIGVGKEVRQEEYVVRTFPQHGLRSDVNPNSSTQKPPTPNPLNLVYEYPYNLYAALISTSAPRVVAATAPAVTMNTPRQKDGFVLISAGIDRVYGTKDDIANFVSY